MKRLLILLVSILALTSCEPESKRPPVFYTIKVTFCDPRPPDTVTLQQWWEPSNRDISNTKRAVPEWGDYYNVCDLKVLSRSDSIYLKQ